MSARAAAEVPARAKSRGVPALRRVKARAVLPRAIIRGYQRYLRIALALPGVEESTGYGTPAVRVRGKFISRWRTEAEGALAIRCSFLDRQVLLQAQPEVFFVTDHYRDYPMILVRLDRIAADALRDLFERAWRMAAPRSLVPSLEGGAPSGGARKERRSRGGGGRHLLR
jgi:hypothetical protein